MPINPYTKEIIKQRVVPRLDNPNAVQNAGTLAQSVSDVTGFASEKIQKAQQEKQTREETIQRARAVSSYKTQMQDEYARFEQEMDLTDPGAAKKFADIARGKAKEAIGYHAGSADSKASLEIQLMALQDSYTAKMTENAYQSQKSFIMNTVGDHINRISKEVYDNPENIDMAFSQINGLVQEYGPALDSVGEIEMVDMAQSVVIEGALNSFIDAGRYEEAKNLIDENPQAIEYMQPSKQMSVMGRIANGIRAQDEERNKYVKNMRAITSAAQEAGVELTPTQVFSATTGIKETQTPEQKVQEFQRVSGLSNSQLTPSVIAKIGFGVDLPNQGDIDMNKERLPDGGYTPKGLGAVIKKPYEDAAATKIQVEKVLLQADEFLNTDNKQAGLASMIAFQKLIDDGAAVREGDIKLSAQGNSAFDNLKLMLDKIEKGGIATPKQVQEMKSSAEIFGKSVLEASKTYIDPYLEEAYNKGYRMIDIGLPQQSYDSIFGKIKTKEDENQRNNQIKTKAETYGMTVEQYLQSTAQQNNMSVEDVAKRLGWSGAIK